MISTFSLVLIDILYQDSRGIRFLLLFGPLQQRIDEQDFSNAIIQLMPLFGAVSSENDIIQCYNYLFQLLPHFDSLDMLENNLLDLLKNSSSLHEYQEKLALHLAREYQARRKHTDAMHCFAKALQINRLKETYRHASEHFVTIFLERLENFLLSTTPTVDSLSL